MSPRRTAVVLALAALALAPTAAGAAGAGRADAASAPEVCRQVLTLVPLLGGHLAHSGACDKAEFGPGSTGTDG